MSAVECTILSESDFTPVGFRWLKLKRVLVKSSSTNQTNVLIISQFRPAVRKTVLELPAGLIDEGETPEETALRELKEETGYTGTVLTVSPGVLMDPGITDSTLQLALVDVDADAPENQDPKPQLQEGEMIQQHLLPLESLLPALLELKASRGWEIDSRLYSFAAGLQMGRMTAPASTPTAAARPKGGASASPSTAAPSSSGSHAARARGQQRAPAAHSEREISTVAELSSPLALLRKQLGAEGTGANELGLDLDLDLDLDEDEYVEFDVYEDEDEEEGEDGGEGDSEEGAELEGGEEAGGSGGGSGWLSTPEGVLAAASLTLVGGLLAGLLILRARAHGNSS